MTARLPSSNSQLVARLLARPDVQEELAEFARFVEQKRKAMTDDPTEIQRRLDATKARSALVGISEAAEILGVSKQRVSQLADLPSFPRPLARLRCGPVWGDAAVRSFAAIHRPNGAPKREAR